MNAPPDQAARDRITGDLRHTLFVEAGAGSGKTTALVDRVVGLVTSGEAELRSIAAITFTEKAGAELRDRLRRRLDEVALDAEAAGHEVSAARCRSASEQLDGAAIGTLHAFAQRILSENPVEARLPPRVEVLDEVRSEVDFERRWTAFRDGLLDDPAMERTLLLLLASGVRIDALRVLALEFDRNWDLVRERVPDDVADPPVITAWLDAALDPIRAVCGQLESCIDDTDKLATRLQAFAAWIEPLPSITDEVDLLEAIRTEARPSVLAGNIGRKGSWRIDVDHLRAEVRACTEELDALVERVATACAQRIGVAVRRFTLQAADERRAEGRLVFHDLLVLARELVTDPDHGADVRERLAARYTHLLLDEFQDTDPIQVELAVRIAAAEPRSPEAGAAPWDEVPVAPGRLFVVGDPKQSIYRFRRADIAVFLAASRRFGPEAGGVVELQANFRTGEPIIGWVNHTFGALMAEPPDAEIPVPSQPDYVDLLATQPQATVGPPVSVLGLEPMGPKATAADLRGGEAREVAAAVTRILAEGWTVRSDDPHDPDDPWRPARLGDITILVPARTSLPFLEDALDAAGVPYRAESSSLVYASRVVRDLLMAVRAVDDPTDALAVVSALRSPLFACGDDDLFRFKVERGGRWSYFGDQPATVPADDPVAAGLACLRTWHEARYWCSPAELIDRIARERRLFELGFAEGRPRDVWRRLRYVIDQARGWREATGGALRDYLHWVQRQTAEGARVAEAILPETDDDAVRIMTVHASKGLEFPITILSGTSTAPQRTRASAEVAFPPEGGVGYRFGRHLLTREFDDWLFLDEQMGFDERVRLLYVACTRAKDHLVVSLQRKDRAKAPEPHKRTNAELLVAGMGDLLDDLPAAVVEVAQPEPIPPAEPPAAPAPFAAWQAELEQALAVAGRPTTVAATALTDEGGPDAADTVPGPSPRAGSTDPSPAPGTAVAVPLPFDQPASAGADHDDGDAGSAEAGLQKRPRDLDLPPWLKGRYGTAVGRAVHGVLQTIDLASGAGLDGAVAAQCEAEAIADRTDLVRTLVQHALGSDVVREAAAAPHWREVYACTPVGDRLLEGYVDLLYRSPEGLVVVDHKTAATSDPALLAERVAGYRLQGASYALSVARTTGEDVVRVVFLFLTPEGPIALDLHDLPDAVSEVTDLVAAGAEHVLA